MENQQTRCTICLEAIDEGQLLTLSCGHEYHIECIYEWMETSYKCPLCRVMICEDKPFSVIYEKDINSVDDSTLNAYKNVQAIKKTENSDIENNLELEHIFGKISFNYGSTASFIDRITDYYKKYPQSFFIFPDLSEEEYQQKLKDFPFIKKYSIKQCARKVNIKDIIYRIISNEFFSKSYTINHLRYYINKSVNQYIDWSGTGSRGIFSYHGDNGRKRAERLRQLYNSGQITSLHDFFAGNIKDENGRSIPGRINSNRHSYISFFLNEIKEDKIVLKRLKLRDTISNDVDYNHSFETYGEYGLIIRNTKVNQAMQIIKNSKLFQHNHFDKEFNSFRDSIKWL